MSVREYLQSNGISDLVKYRDHHAMDAVSFIGTLRKHPYDSEKCLLLTSGPDSSAWFDEGTILEFRVADVCGADELPSPVDETGAAWNLIRLWIRKGSIGLKYEPFEVGEKPLYPKDSRALRARFSPRPARDEDRR